MVKFRSIQLSFSSIENFHRLSRVQQGVHLMSAAQSFLYPYRSSMAANCPQEIIFDANLQEFAQRVGYIASLETGGKLSQHESYRAIEQLWRQLSASHQQLKAD